MSIRNWKTRGIPRLLLALLFASFAPGAFAATIDFTTDTGIYDGSSTTRSVTQAGETVENTATLGFEVNSVAQTDVTAGPVSFLVDRVLDVSVDAVDNTASQGVNTSTNAVFAFDVTNESNDNVDIPLYVARLGEDVIGDIGTPAGAVTTTLVDICVDDGADGTCDTSIGTTPGIYTLQGGATTGGTTIAAGQPARILVTVAVPANVADQSFDSWYVAAALTDAGSGAGTRITCDDNGQTAPDGGTCTDSADDPTVVENVFADEAEFRSANFSTPAILAGGGAFRDGQDADFDQLVVESPNMTLQKEREVIYDPLVGLKYDLTEASGFVTVGSAPGTDAQTPNAIPGAIVMYTLDIENEGTGAASDVTLTDVIATAVEPGNDEALSVLDGTYCTGSANPSPSGVANGASCDSNVVTALDSIMVEPCQGADTTAVYSGSGTPPRDVDVNIGTCDGGETARIRFFVTVP